ncbi:recombination protein RecO [Helicobacter sp. CaF467b]|uniref:recombination protein RecO n=1 Tax=Helicobacter sp. CaF467b TaxID=2919923 RepID=UPI001F56C6D5|nr:recombination protein RecO [Helicobacter sp. CaF467b]MCI2235568.1 recombination protein RecO [Helicobacter sp. CaF467b]
MQGFILHTQRVREEDLIVRILSHTHLHTLYRFYGARHSIIHLGNKIDFVIEQDLREIGKLREPIHLAFQWECESSKRYYWQQYLNLLNQHLRDVNHLDSFYFEHLQKGAKYLQKEEPKRCILNLYVRLLEFEGRKNPLLSCLVCERELGEEIVLGRGVVCGHKGCLQGEVFNKEHIKQWLDFKGEFLEDEEVEKLWNLLKLGL